MIEQDLNQAIEHLQAGRLAEAETLCRGVLQRAPQTPEAYRLLGLVAFLAGRLDMAEPLLRQAILLAPFEAVYASELSLVLHALKRYAEAEAAARQALQLQPGLAEAEFNLANALRGQGKLDAALLAYQRALTVRADFPQAELNLGNTLLMLNRPQEAIAAYRRALALQPGLVEAENNQAHAELMCNNSARAIQACQRALALRPDYVEAEHNYGNALLIQGRSEEAEQHFRRAVALRPTYAIADSYALCAAQYRPGITAAELAGLHAAWETRHAAAFRSEWQPFPANRDSERRLRLGFVSPDFRLHPVGFFLLRVLESLDRRSCEVICYSDPAVPDEFTERFAQAADQWHPVNGLPDEALAGRIRADRIDLLFDLTGHTANNRLLTFARKPAPIQLTWLGYVGTTGLAAMDYLLADRHHVPEGEDTHYREKVLRLPDGYVCFEPPAIAPPVGSLPARSQGHVTFGSFNAPAKIAPPVTELWSEILKQVPGSRLLLVYTGFDDEAVQRRYRDLFVAQDIDADRLEMHGRVPHRQLLEQYLRVDITLDPFPYSGGLTTCEALWMGVPVVTWPGQTFAGRHSLSHLSNVGLTATIARDAANYVEIAVGLAGDLERLAQLRASLREQVARSPLCDGPRFAAHFLTLLRSVWRRAGAAAAD